MTDNRWHDVDFRPAPPGWRAIYLDAQDRPVVEQIAGWLIQEKGARPVPPAHPESPRPVRRVVPAFHRVADWGVDPIPLDQVAGLYRIVAPGEAVPSAEEIADEKAAAA